MKAGNKQTPFAIIGASNHSEREREPHDFYATDNIAAYLLAENEELKNVWECACGDGELAKVFKNMGILARASDLVDRGYGEPKVDFLSVYEPFNGDIVTNPPYSHAEEFVRHAYNLITEGNKVCMFLKLTFLESKSRKKMFEEIPLKTLYVSSSRIRCYRNNDRSSKSNAMAFGWYVWEKGYTGEPTIKWIN